VGPRFFWAEEENLGPTAIRSPDRPNRLSYPGPHIIKNDCVTFTALQYVRA